MVDNVMMQFIVNSGTDALKTDINLFFTITNSPLSFTDALHEYYKFMCLSAY